MLDALVTQYRAKMAQATASTQAFGASVLTSAQKNQAAFTTMGVAALGFAAGIGYALKFAADAAIEFESAFAGVRKTVDGTDEELAVIEQGIRDMAKEVPISAVGLAKIAEAAGQLGIAKEGILDFTRTVADLGVTTNLVEDEAANALARIANIMGTAEGDFSNLGSAIVALGNSGASTEAEIVDFALRIAGAGKIAGLAESDILAIGNAMASVGVESEAGGTAVQKVLISITEAVQAGGPELEKFAETAGMSASEFASAWASDPAAAFTAFVEGLGTQGQSAISTLKDLNLTDQRLIRSFLALAGAGDLLGESIETGSAAWEENSALAEEAGKRYDTTAARIQMSFNQITDAGISFGALLLPVIASIVGAIGDVADLIGGLPGPVKALAIAFGIAAAGIALFAGAALIALPRVAAMKEAMRTLGIQGGAVRGILSASAGAFNVYSLAATAAAAGLVIWAQKAAESRARVEALTSAIEQDNGMIGQNTRLWVANRLAKEGGLEASRELGLSFEEVVDAAMGEAEALEHVRDVVDEALLRDIDLTPAANEIRSLLGTSRDELEKAAAVTEAVGDATEDTASSTDELGQAQEGAAAGAAEHAEGLDEVAEAAKAARTDAERLTSALEELAGVQITAEEAALGWGDALHSMREELQRGTKTLSLNTQSGRDNRAVILDAIDAAMAHGAAVADETGSVKRGAAAAIEHIKQIMRTAEAAGVSEGEIRDYIRELNLTPRDIRTAIALVGGDEARSTIEAVRRAAEVLNGTRAYVTIVTNREGFFGGTVPHAGGTVGSSMARRMHAGGDVPALRGDEVPIIAQRGERVLTRNEWTALRSITGNGARPRRAPSSPHGSGELDLTGLTIRGTLTTPFGMAEIRGLIVDTMRAKDTHAGRLQRMNR